MSTYGSEFISSLRPAKYKYINELKDKGVNTEKIHFGVMAQDIRRYLESVSEEDFNIVQHDDEGNLMVNYNELIGPIIKTIHELTEKVESLERKVQDLEINNEYGEH